MRKPPATFKYTSWPESLTPQWASSTASTTESRLGSQPTTARLGVPSEVGATSACNSTNTGRVPSMPANTAVPGLPRSRSDRNSSDGLETSRSPSPVISNTPISSVGPNRFFTARRMRNCCEPSPSNDNTASTMCSTTRGPAIWPSLVTWPTRMMAAPVFLANLISACAEARTCVTVPGADSTVSVHMVWIESITISRGTVPSDSVETMSSTEVSAASCTAASASPSRSARSRTCATASSPEMYTTRWPARAIRLVACVNSVDLPIPGSPPTSSTEPRTNPPPVTRSSSVIPEGRRGASWLLPVRLSSANSRPFRLLRIETGMLPVVSSSTSVFHSPQDSHLPCQRLYADPQFWQTNESADLAIGSESPLIRVPGVPLTRKPRLVSYSPATARPNGPASHESTRF